MKQCSRCKKTKPFVDFYKSSTNSGGYSNYCKTCQSAYDKAKYSSRRVYPEKVVDGKYNCRRCGGYFEKGDMHRQKSNKYESFSYCKECSKHLGHRHNLKRFGLSADEYVEMEKQQDYKCMICGGKDSKRLSVDHNHNCCGDTNACSNCIRGLLCSKCNKGLGSFNDDLELLQKAINYLKAFEK